MTDARLDRRDLLTAGALLSVGAAVLPASAAAAAPIAVGYAPLPLPLPFDPKSITGFSEKLLTSHHDNNYVGAVKRIGAITEQVAALDPATAPGFQINGLKREELIAWNSMILHELYFAGLGAPSKPGAKLAAAIERDFGSNARWRAEFADMGKALGGGSGWVLLTYSHRDNRLVNQWAADHSMTLAGSTPILALDMYEHAYAMDYGAKAAAYVDAFMATTNWASADARFAKVA
ncbi:superoxide dismutase [Sphingomonas asaccharolytica]|uniref:superoxide dismutase n=1 Tax=Sphingomonas asaccharolytica TaxID=40681 RepID=UPI000A06E318|nr:Fe-Mn family superoxide dismutase [Sphingomonas asaccharolytica]